MSIKRIILVGIFCSLFCLSNAQKDKFTTFTAANYIGEIAAFLEQDKGSDKNQLAVNEAMLKKYTPIWTEYSKINKERIVEISNQLLKQKIRPQPDFYKFVQVQIVFKNSTQTTQSFDNWISCMELLFEKKKKLKDFISFIEYTDNILVHRIIYESRSSKWEASQSATFMFDIVQNKIVVVFNKPFELYYNSDKDGGTIFGTTGIYDVFDNEWMGKGGKIDWGRTGLSSTEVWATLNTYIANTKFPKFMADSVAFVNKKYFKEPVYGRLEEQLVNQMEPEKYVFPKFRSYKKDFIIPSILPEVDYRGSFMMNGSKFITSDTKNPATLIFYRDNKPFAIVTSFKFFITSDRVTSEGADIKIYIDGDSIYNSGVDVRYIAGDKNLSFINPSNRNYYGPYSNTYHNLDMYCESITWDKKEDVLDLAMLRQQGTQSFSTFESSNYYSLNKYREIQGIDETSPLQRVYRYMKNRNSDEFYLDEFAQFIKMDIMQAKLMIHNLSKAGLLNYNEGEGRVYVKQKLPDYSRAYAKSPGIDYDALILMSETANTSNAILDLKTNELAMKGVRKFVVSDTHQVAIYPKGGNVVVKKNRNIVFNGLINAGRFLMYVSDAVFDYTEFKLVLPKVDSMMFYVKSFTDLRQDAPLVRVRTPIHSLKGEILIDKSNNRSGLKKTKGYPIFNSLEDSYAYYDNPVVRKGVYTRDRFYYTLHPFSIKNMMTFETDSLIFNGILTSAGIFPELKEPLRVQKDYSLGFVMETPPSGLPAYRGKGQYKKTIDLSYNGLLGSGDVEYLTSVSRASKNNIVFMPDSMLAVTDTFFIKENGLYPDVRAGKVNERWLPYQDEMYVYSRKTPFQMYRNEAKFRGYLILKPSGLTGNGTAQIRESELYADLFEMSSRNMSSKNSEFKLRSELFNGLAFYAANVKSNIDFEKQKGDFTSNGELERVELEIMQYAAYVDMFSWEMNKKELTLLNSKSQATQGMNAIPIDKRIGKIMPGARYVSTNPQQDSLSFRAVKGVYKYNEGKLTTKDVFLIEVADAAIAPKGDSVRIFTGAKMDKISQSQILANVTDKYHLFYDADVTVLSKNQYNATGYINYIDETGAKQKIALSNISPNTSRITIGSGYISDSIGFTLSPAFGYMGNVTVNAQEQYYTFTGGVQLRHTCKASEEKLGFMKFKGMVDPKDIVIPVEEIPTDLNGKRMTASILFSKSNLEPYSAFLTLDKAVDNDIINASGYLAYNKARKEYRIGSMEKVDNPVENTGQYLALKTESCDVVGEGILNFQIKQNFVKLLSYGTIEVNNTKTETEINMMLGFSFPFLEQALNMMGQYISDDLGLAPADLGNENIRRALCTYLGDEKGNATFSDLSAMGEYEKIPEVFRYTLFFDNIKWKYSPNLGYYCNTRAALGMVGKMQIHKMITTRMQLHKRGTGTELRIFLQVDRDHWYYFNYNCDRQIMRVYSSIGEFNDLIRNTKEGDRVVEGKSTEGTYRYSLGTKNEAESFSRNLSDIENPNHNIEDYDEEEESDME